MKERTRNNHCMKCPWCGYEDQDSWELEHECESETDCGNCGNPIIYNAEISVTWNSYKGEIKKEAQP